MLKPSRKPRPCCTRGDCKKVCTDGLVVDWANDRRERDSGWQTTDLNRGADQAAPGTAHHTPADRQPPPTWPDINRRHTAAIETFEARMDELIRQVRGHG